LGQYLQVTTLAVTIIIAVPTSGVLQRTIVDLLGDVASPIIQLICIVIVTIKAMVVLSVAFVMKIIAF
jgi:hypothetical protein